MECKISYMVSCVALIVSGLAALYSLISGDLLHAVGYVLALEAISIGIVAARARWELAFQIVVVLVVLVASKSSMQIMHYAAIIAAYAAAVVAGARSVSSGLAWLAVPAHSLAAIVGSWAYPLIGALSLLAASTVVYEYTRKGHAFVLATLAPVALAMGSVSILAGAGALAAGIFASGLTSDKATCPFRRDSLMAMVGSLLALAGVLWAWVSGFEAGGFPHVLWVTGMLFLEAASLVPLGPSGSRLS